MTAPRLPDRDAAQVDALVADRYLDALLAAGDRRADDAPADAALAPDLRHAARVLRRSLVRVHPSFRFEERLATRLADLAAAQSGSALAAAGGGTDHPRSRPLRRRCDRRRRPPGPRPRTRSWAPSCAATWTPPTRPPPGAPPPGPWTGAR